MTDSLDTTGHATSRDEQEQQLFDSVSGAFPSTMAQLSDLIRIPSVSWPAFEGEHVRRSAEAVARLARETGVFDSVQICQASIVGGEDEDLGQPAVVATRAAKNGRPTVMLYAHHDVQPPGADADWETEPYVPTVRGDRLYGRGAADDKAGVMVHIASINALAEQGIDHIDLGIVLFIEGEEEYGSPSFTSFLKQHHESLRADVIVVADSENWNVDTPALTVGLRGNVTFTLTIRTLDHASHSGMFGGAVPDAMLAMIKLLGSLHDAEGSVAVNGLTTAHVNMLEYSEQQLRDEAGLLDGVVPIGTGNILSRMWSKPAITVTGIDAPSVANASNTLSPRVSVRVSARIAPGQDAKDAYEALEKHIHDNAPFGAHVEITDIDMGNPFLVDTSGWAVAEAKRAMADAWGVEAVETCIGGSIPFIAELVTTFPEAQILVTGVEDPDTRAHSPNESLHLGVFKRAILTEAFFLHRLNERSENSFVAGR
jgi:acetylornithine deacetylase/succinyl-diaminopimelate desuccinylase-like protein